jgi:hypothetical protein
MNNMGSAGAASRLYKDSNRKQSQANQKRRHQGEDAVGASQANGDIISGATLSANNSVSAVQQS